jgi:hypothetical protein
LLREYREAFGSAEDLREVVERILVAGLVESEPPRASDYGSTNALRVTATGAYYWQYLVRSFAYVDLVYVDTPIYDEKLAKYLAHAAETTKDDVGFVDHMELRFERVQKFMECLRDLEKDELQRAASHGGPFAVPLYPEIEAQLRKEIQDIRVRVGIK